MSQEYNWNQWGSQYQNSRAEPALQNPKFAEDKKMNFYREQKDKFKKIGLRQGQHLNIDEMIGRMVVTPGAAKTTAPSFGATVVPYWIKNEEALPGLYRLVFRCCCAGRSVDTNRIYSILLTSGLPREVLGHIWSQANVVVPGQLSKEELYMCLALVALAQSGYTSLTVVDLHTCLQPPLPYLNEVYINSLVEQFAQPQMLSSNSNSPRVSTTNSNSPISATSPHYSFPATTNQSQSSIGLPKGIQTSGLVTNHSHLSMEQICNQVSLDNIAKAPWQVPGQLETPGALDKEATAAEHRSAVSAGQLLADQFMDTFNILNKKHPSVTTNKENDTVLDDDFGDYQQCGSGSSTAVLPITDDIAVDATFTKFATTKYQDEVLDQDFPDDFGDFLQAKQLKPPAIGAAERRAEKPPAATSSSRTSQSNSLFGADDDKYAAFRSLEVDLSGPGDFNFLHADADTTGMTEDFADFQKSDSHGNKPQSVDVFGIDQLNTTGHPKNETVGTVSVAGDAVNVIRKDSQLRVPQKKMDFSVVNRSLYEDTPPVNEPTFPAELTQSFEADFSQMSGSDSCFSLPAKSKANDNQVPRSKTFSALSAISKMTGIGKRDRKDSVGLHVEVFRLPHPDDSHSSSSETSDSCTTSDSSNAISSCYSDKPCDWPSSQKGSSNLDYASSDFPANESAQPHPLEDESDEFGEFSACDSSSMDPGKLPQKAAFFKPAYSNLEDSWTVLTDLNTLHSKVNQLHPSVNQSQGYDVAAETLSKHSSVPSLDLPPLDEVSANHEFAEFVISNGVEDDDTDVQVAKLPVSLEKIITTAPIFGDRYSTVLADMLDNDKHAKEWGRCLLAARDSLKQANDIFNDISAIEVCQEVIDSAKGSVFISAIVGIYKICRRVCSSMSSIGIVTEELATYQREIEILWTNFSAFISTSPYMPDPSTLDYSDCHVRRNESDRACGVCLLDVSIDNKLLYLGREYHSMCANFWFNKVDSVLPALSLVDLLS